MKPLQQRDGTILTKSVVWLAVSVYAVFAGIRDGFSDAFCRDRYVQAKCWFSGGKATGELAEFWVRSIQVEPIDAPARYKGKRTGVGESPQPESKSLVHLGGRWYFHAKGTDEEMPQQFDHTNAKLLLYKSAHYEAPFAGNMTSWLQAGYLDLQGEAVKQDEYRPDNLVVTVTKDHVVMQSKNLPNHPTASFPDRWRILDGNPAYIKEQANKWSLPLEPRVNPDHFAKTAKNENGGLPGGAIEVAVNGVIFFTPFNHIFETDAVWRLDRCCGHPSPQNQYHYHKYPVCMKTPWSDEGNGHSNVIGFAFDDFRSTGHTNRRGCWPKTTNKFAQRLQSARRRHARPTLSRHARPISSYYRRILRRGRIVEATRRPAYWSSKLKGAATAKENTSFDN